MKGYEKRALLVGRYCLAFTIYKCFSSSFSSRSLSDHFILDNLSQNINGLLPLFPKTDFSDLRLALVTPILTIVVSELYSHNIFKIEFKLRLVNIP